MGALRLRELYGWQPMPDSRPRWPMGLPGMAELDPLASADELVGVQAAAPEQVYQERQRRLETLRMSGLALGGVSYTELAHAQEVAALSPAAIIYEQEGGGYIVVELNEHQLQRVASGLQGTGEQGYGFGRVATFEAVGLHVGGEEITDPSSLSRQWYSEDIFAEIGPEGSSAEAVIYRMGEQSYGRMDLTHEQALALWTQLDGLTWPEVQTTVVEGWGPFHNLRVRQHGRIISVDRRYFRGRDEFYEFADRQDLGATLYYSRDLLHFISIESAREEPEARFVSTLYLDDRLARFAADQVYDSVWEITQQLALDTLLAAQRDLEALVATREAMAAYVLRLGQLSDEERREGLVAIGCPLDVSEVSAALGDQETVWRIVLGLSDSYTETWTEFVVHSYGMDVSSEVEHSRRVSWDLDAMMSWTRTTISELGDAAEQVRTRQVSALDLEGELGEHVRRLAYDRLGFTTLDPADYPHDSVTSSFMPSPMEATTPTTDTLRERLFANVAARKEDVNTLETVLTIGVVALATVALIFLSMGVGAAVAGVLFAEGTLAYSLTSFAVAGLVFQAGMELGSLALTGEFQSDSVLEFIGMSALHAVTFGIFHALNGLFMGIGISAATRAGLTAGTELTTWGTRLAHTVRIGMLGATFLSLSLAQHVAEHGDIPRGTEAWLFAYENVLMLALLEGGGFFARNMGLFDAIGRWSEGVRLGELAEPVRVLRADVVRHQQELASIMVRPQAGPRDGPELARVQERLLERQAELLEQVGEQSRIITGEQQMPTDIARALESTRSQLEGLRQARFLGEQQIAPDPSQAIVGDGEVAIFTYEGATEAARTEAIQRFREFYGEQNVEVGEQGFLRVQAGNRELLFRPRAEGELMGSFPGAPPEMGTSRPIPTGGELATRRDQLRRIARRLGLETDAITALEGMNLGSRTQVGSRIQGEQAIVRAEADVARRLAEVDATTREAALRDIDPAEAARLEALNPEVVDPLDVAAIAALQQSLALRRDFLLARAARMGVADPALDAIRPNRLVLSTRTRPASLAEADALIAAAETGVGRQMVSDLLTQTATMRGRFDEASLELIRAGELNDVTDLELAEALWPIARNTSTPSPGAVRGLLFAARGGVEGPVDIAALLRAGRSFSRADQYWALEQYAALCEARVDGATRLLAQMARDTGSFRGGVFALEYTTQVVSLQEVVGVEMRVEGTTGGREIDVLLADGRTVELKDWSEWHGDGEGFRRQTELDFELATSNFTNPEGMQVLRYAFRSPAPRTAGEIRAYLRERLVQSMRDREVPLSRWREYLDAFDAHTAIVEIPALQRSSGELPRPSGEPVYLPPTSGTLPDEEPPPVLLVPPRLPGGGSDYDGPDY